MGSLGRREIGFVTKAPNESGEIPARVSAAAPSLFYADWAEPIGADLTALRAYRARLLAKLKLTTNAELTRYALEHGLLE